MSEAGGAIEIAKALGPTDATRETFARSWLGSSLGQTVVLVGMILSYVAILALTWTFAAGPLGAMKDAFGEWFWVLMTAPIAVILAFNVVPAALRARRERQLKRAAFSGGPAFQPSYFRLHPYGTADAGIFKRLDGADIRLLDWLRGARDPILYLSGPSGSGKSSLVAASLEPKLRAEGWEVVNTRLFADPLRQVLLAFAPGDDRPASPDHVHDVIAAAVAAHRAARRSPLLLIADQFEEYLILGDAARQEPLQRLIQRLAAEPIDGLKLLLCLRSDYQALIFQQALPSPRSPLNWFQLAPYRRGDAEAFL